MPSERTGNRTRRWLTLAVLFALVFVAGCAHRLPVSRPPSTVPPPVPGRWSEQGLASWYGVPFYGRRAADGEIYNMYKMVAAHRTLPFNSLVRVTDLQNGRQIVVRIIDRGPFVKNRIIDLSFGAARALDMVGPGVAPVRSAIDLRRESDGGRFHRAGRRLRGSAKRRAPARAARQQVGPDFHSGIRLTERPAVPRSCRRSEERRGRAPPGRGTAPEAGFPNNIRSPPRPLTLPCDGKVP